MEMVELIVLITTCAFVLAGFIRLSERYDKEQKIYDRLRAEVETSGYALVAFNAHRIKNEILFQVEIKELGGEQHQRDIVYRFQNESSAGQFYWHAAAVAEPSEASMIQNLKRDAQRSAHLL